MNEIKVFENDYLEELRKVSEGKKSPFIGFVYILEWADKVKIGSSISPDKRIGQLKATAKYAGAKLGRIAITDGHTNYLENEKKLHKHFRKARLVGTELFDISFDEVLKRIPDLILEDKSSDKAKLAEEFLDLMKDFVLGTSSDEDHVECPICGEICDAIYMDRTGTVFACDKCVIDQDSYTWNKYAMGGKQ